MSEEVNETHMTKRIFLTVVLSAGAILAQSAGMPAPRDLTELKNYLNLSDAQVAQLRQIQSERMANNRNVIEQIAQKEKQLRDALSQPGANAQALGSLLLEIKALRDQLAANDKKYSDLATAALTAEQKTKLKTLQDAQQLLPAIHQAAAVGILQPLSPPAFLPRFGHPGGFPGFGPAWQGAGLRMLRR